jgi:hypothetical protein
MIADENAVNLLKNRTSIGLSLHYGSLGRLSAALGSLDLKCSKSPKEQNLYRAFAALRELRAARRRFGLVFILNAVNLLKNTLH